MQIFCYLYLLNFEPVLMGGLVNPCIWGVCFNSRSYCTMPHYQDYMRLSPTQTMLGFLLVPCF